MKKLFCVFLLLCVFLQAAYAEAVPTVSDEGTLLYYESFDGFKATHTNNKTMTTLGWSLLTKQDDALTDPTAVFLLKDVDGDGKLSITNAKGKDTYVEILSPAQLGFYHTGSYTVQFDLSFFEPCSSEDGIAVLANYGGASYLAASVFGNGSYGYAKEQNGVTVSEKRLPAEVDCSGVITLRCCVDNQTVSIYVKSSDASWLTLCEGEAGADTGAALGLMVTGSPSLYVDNLIVYTGLGEVPDLASAFLDNHDGKTVCSGHLWTPATCLSPEHCVYCGETTGEALPHEYVQDALGYNYCTICGQTEDAIVFNWVLADVPAYEGGIKSESPYNCGQGISATQDIKLDNYMILIAETNAEEYKAYLAKLNEWGFECVQETQTDDNLYAAFTQDERFVYTYYTANTNTVRVIKDTSSTKSVADFGYTYEKQADEATVIYQVGLPMYMGGASYKDDGGRLKCGMMYVIKLADGKLFILDGGGYQQFDNAQIEGVMALLREISGKGEGEKIDVACWYVSHGHSDHMSGLCRLFTKYHESFNMERLMFNIPSINMYDEYAEATSLLKKFSGYLLNWFPDAEYLKIHTGEQIHLADVVVDVLETHEDYVNATTGLTRETGDDYNNSCSVLMMTIDDKKFMVLGDVNKPIMKMMMQNYSEDTLKCDIVQIAHHALNDLTDLYRVTQAEVALVPQSVASIQTIVERLLMMRVVDEYTQQTYYAGNGTTGLQVIDGQITKVYEGPVFGDDYDGIWKW